MNIRRIMAINRRIIAQFRRDHRSLALLFVAPLVIMLLLGYVFRAQESNLVKVALVNEDLPAAGQASAAGPIVSSLKSSHNLEVTSMSRVDAEEAVRQARAGVAILFPADFTQQLGRSHRATVEAIVEGSNPMEASVALSAAAQAVVSSGPAVMREMLPAGMQGLAPSSPPVELVTRRLYGSSDLKPLDFFAPMFIAYIGFFLIFLLTSVSFLRERTQGTMERLAASPVTRLELVLGYMLGFGLFALVQAVLLLLFTIYVLQVKYSGNMLSIFVVTVALVLGAVNLGILLSAFAKNELQAIQFIPLVILPQVILSGLLWPVSQMPVALQAIARLMPLTYAIEALTNIMIRGQSLAGSMLPLLVLFGFAAAMLLLAAASVRREVA
ncbi:MAG: ABC transporter permease [Chloroflexota bacterium]|nr:ABC transporter permease [Chloroflexota bacterium]